MDNDTTVWNTTPIIVTKHTALGESINHIKDFQLIQNTDITGFAALKKANKKNMAKKALLVAKPTTTFARDTKKTVLLEEVDFELTDIIKAKNSDALEYCNLIHDRGTDYLSEMGDYPITIEALEKLDAAINLFDLSMPTPDAAHSEVSAVTKAIDLEIELVDNILLGMDELMVTFKTTETDFYNTYLSARRIIDIGVRRILMWVKCLDAVSGAIVKGAEVYIAELGITLSTTKTGNARFFSLPPGSYTVTITHELYQPVTLNDVGIFEGKTTRFDLELVRS